MMKKLAHGLVLGLLAACVSLLLWSVGWLDWLEYHVWDTRQCWLAGAGRGSGSVRLIFLDQATLDWAESDKKLPWPWPREVYAPIIDFCKRGGARAIAFDVLFSESSREGVESDLLLGSTMAAAEGFTTSLFLSRNQGKTTNWPAEIRSGSIAVADEAGYFSGKATAGLRMAKASFPVAEIATNCAMMGNVFAEADADAVVRRIAPIRIFDGRFVPALGLSAYVAANPGARVRVSDGALNVGDFRIPLDSGGNAILRYRGPSQNWHRTAHGYKTVNAAAVIESELRMQDGRPPVIDPAFFCDAYVFFGFTAPALGDLKPTPVGRVFPGVEIQATFLDNLISGDFVVGTSSGVLAGFVVLFGLACGALGRLCRNAGQTTIAFLVLLPLALLPGFAAYRAGHWLPVAPAETAAAIALVGAVIVNYAVEGRQKRFIKGAFGQYLSPVVIDRLVRDPSQLVLGGETRELSILFSDIRGFTSISESLDPARLTSFLNEYLSAMSDIVMDEGGMIDKYEGDAIIAFWNAPLFQPDHAIRAVRAALLCDRKLAELRPHFRDKYGKDIHARIGINTGKVVVGNMGSRRRFNYTFIGDAGNLASRLEGLNKLFGTSVMASEYTRAQLGGEFETREVSRVRVVGRRDPVRVYEPMFKEAYTARAELIMAFTRGLERYYYGDFEKAAGIFSEISGEDATAGVYAERCRRLIEHPPHGAKGEWDGVWEMTEK